MEEDKKAPQEFWDPGNHGPPLEIDFGKLIKAMAKDKRKRLLNMKKEEARNG